MKVIPRLPLAVYFAVPLSLLGGAALAQSDAGGADRLTEIVVTARKRERSFFVRNFHGFAEDLVLRRLLAQNPLEFTDALLKHFNLGRTHDFLIDPDRFLPTLGPTPSPVKQQGGRNTMRPGSEGKRIR